MVNLYEEFERLRSNLKDGTGNALIAVRRGYTLRTNYFSYWDKVDANGDIDATVYSELDLGSAGKSRRRRSARCAIRISILQAFTDLDTNILTLRQLQNHWEQVGISRLQPKCEATLTTNLIVNDIAALCRVPAPRVKKILHPRPPLMIQSYGEDTDRSSHGQSPERRNAPDVENDELKAIASLERATLGLTKTVRKAVVEARADNGLFRDLQISKWKTCSVTGTRDIRLLDACHIKPWSVCDDLEKLDVDNGLLLTPNLHRLFDLGLITFDEAGRIRIAKNFSSAEGTLIGIHDGMALRKPMCNTMLVYMRYHNRHVFRNV